MKGKKDTTNYRRQVWEREYKQRHLVPSTNAGPDHPSRAFRTMLEKFPKIPKDLLLDLGSGNGRNLIWAIKDAGFQKAVGIEFVHAAVKNTNESIQTHNLGESILVLEQSVGEPFPIASNSCTVVLEMMTMHALTQEVRAHMVAEVSRVLKPGGYIIGYTISALREFNGEKTAFADLAEKNPGPEENSYRFMVENDVVTEKGFTEHDLQTIFPGTEVVYIQPNEEFSQAFGDVYKRIYYTYVLRKV